MFVFLSLHSPSLATQSPLLSLLVIRVFSTSHTVELLLAYAYKEYLKQLPSAETLHELNSLMTSDQLPERRDGRYH